MAETQASIGYGVLFNVSTDNGATFTPIAEVYDITPPSSTIDTIDATHSQSPDANREFIIGLNDPGEASFEMNFVPGSASDIKIQSIQAARARVKCQVVYPNGVTWTFYGLLTGYEPAVPTDDKMTSTVTFKVSGSTVVGATTAAANTVLPAISGLSKVGTVLTALEGSWQRAASFTYQWKKAGANIAGATQSTYTPVAGDVGGAITVAVTAVNGAGSTTATSAATPAVIA